MNAPLKFYVNRQLVDERLSCTPLLYPFWPPKIKAATPFASALWQRYTFDSAYYALVPEVTQADAILLPHNYWLWQRCQPERLQACLREAAQHQKPLVIDAYGDSAADLPVKNAVILRTSQYRFALKPHEIMLPAYVEDLREAYPDLGAATPRPKVDVPVVGFTGWAELPTHQAVKTWLKAASLQLRTCLNANAAYLIPGVILRKQLVHHLQGAPGLRTNFQIRNTYSGHQKTVQGDFQRLRREFISNILESDYTLTVKGNGNYSQRFYETLSLGRIPLFVDTACVLPLEAQIDYTSCCVVVDAKDRRRLAEMLCAWHQRMTPEQFIEMQHRARAIFETYLRVDRFTPYLMEEIAAKLKVLRER